MYKRFTLFILIAWTVCLPGQSQQQPANYDESKVPAYTLPALLVSNDGREITSARKWEKIRRPEILSLFSEQMFGKFPKGKIKTTYETLSFDPDALNHTAERRQIKITFEKNGIQHEATLLIYYPKQVEGKVPVFLSYNYFGNHTVNSDEGIIITSSWSRNDQEAGVKNNQVAEAPRGFQSSRWPIQKILDAGYAVATACYNDFFPDAKEQTGNSILALFDIQSSDEIAPDHCQAIGTWAWGMSRMMDYLEKDPRIEADKVILMGHSRQGKAALWAGAQDKRFRIVISNDSGCGGAALSRRKFGETIQAITNSFPHWFCKNFNRYRDNEEALPFDQHALIALIAPRPVYVASAEQDLWADPQGEYLAAYHASEVYRLYGLKGLETKTMPPLNSPVMTSVGYHIRTGIHDVTDFDWESYIQFANKWLDK